MPSWTPITADDLLQVRAAKLIEALASKALGDTQDDPTASIVAGVVAELRAAIAFSGRSVLDADSSRVPASMKDLVMQRVIRLMKGRLLMTLNETEREDDRQYQRRLELLTQGKWPVETPDTPATSSTVQSGAPAQVVSSARIASSRRRFAGL